MPLPYLYFPPLEYAPSPACDSNKAPTKSKPFQKLSLIALYTA